MYKINGRQLNQEYLSIFYIQLLILFVYVDLLNFENRKIINNYDSEIHLIIKGTGEQNIINRSFQSEPSEVIVNGYTNVSCKKTCYLSNDLNKTVIFFFLIILKNFIQWLQFYNSTLLFQINYRKLHIPAMISKVFLQLQIFKWKLLMLLFLK